MIAIELRGSTIAVKIKLEMVMKIISTVVEFLDIENVNECTVCLSPLQGVN